MAGFAPQPDEGYSEDPLTALSASASFFIKPREDSGTSSASSIRPGDEFPLWLMQHISGLSTSRKTELAMALLNDLPTTVISQIVNNLYPRLYIDFVRYLPPEVCLKILGYLDPVALINVARCCRAWYDLALDRKLWQGLYYMEGWKARDEEIATAEREVSGTLSSSHGALRRAQSQDDGHAHKKRAISLSPNLDADMDMMMVDAGSSVKQEPAGLDLAETSIFGGPRGPTGKACVSRQPSDVDMRSAGPGSSSKGKAIDKGKGRALSPGFPESAHFRDRFLQTILAPRCLDKPTLWLWDGSSGRFKINWKHLYTMRRRLESNWEKAKYTNFQFPKPEHPEEGHKECVYTLQFDSQYLVTGSRDRTLKVWDMKTRRCLRTLAKHRGSVLCLQFDSDPDEDIIVSGSSDSDVIIWKFSTGEELLTLRLAHRESVLNVKFDKRILVTCSKDRTIKIFNRKPLRHGDLGYSQTDPVPRNVRDYGYNLPLSPSDFPEIPAWTMIGCLEGHSAAVNAVQIHEREVVSASGDRHIKVWDWPTQVCTRTIIGHNKGIACVQYDGRRIVSGSSDHEVKVFDRQTGLEVANLRSHSALVRTVQAGFGDLPYSIEDDFAEAKKVDQEYFKALESGLIPERDRRPRSGRRTGNAGSRRPQDICAYGAKLPPGGGGGKYGRIVSGSYDASIIIWRRDSEGVWKDQHHFKQEEASSAARRQDGLQNGLATIAADPSASMLFHGAGAASASHAVANQPTLPPLSTLTMQLSQVEASRTSMLEPNSFQGVHQVIDEAIQGGQQTFARAIAAYPAILSHRSYVEVSVDRVQSPLIRSQLRQTFSGALIRAQFEQARLRREALRNTEALAPASASTAADHVAAGPRNLGPAALAPSLPTLTPAQLAAAEAHQAHAHVPQAANMQQLQYDARRIICCSQRSVIVGWDFCNGDPELEEASRFFGHI
ncbi:WD40 repeat-like protein, partial [Trichocladium antarcticum]